MTGLTVSKCQPWATIQHGNVYPKKQRKSTRYCVPSFSHPLQQLLSLPFNSPTLAVLLNGVGSVMYCSPCVGRMLAECWLNVGRMLAECWLVVNLSLCLPFSGGVPSFFCYRFSKLVDIVITLTYITEHGVCCLAPPPSSILTLKLHALISQINSIVTNL